MSWKERLWKEKDAVAASDMSNIEAGIKEDRVALILPSSDTTGATDSTALVGGGVKRLAEGTFYINANILGPNLTYLEGLGPEKTIIRTVGAIPAFNITQGNAQYVVLRNLTVFGNNAGTVGYKAASGNIGNVIENVLFLEFTGRPIELLSADRVYMKQVWANGCGEGALMAACTRATIDQLVVERCGTVDITFRECDQFAIQGLSVEQTTGSGKKGVVFDSCIGIDVSTFWAFGQGGQETALEINNATKAGRTSVKNLKNINATGFTNVFKDETTSPPYVQTEGEGGLGQYADQIVASTIIGRAEVRHKGLYSTLTGGGVIYSGSGAPEKPAGNNPKAGDIWFRTDKPAGAKERMYICTTGGATPVWEGVV